MRACAGRIIGNAIQSSLKDLMLGDDNPAVSGGLVNLLSLSMHMDVEPRLPLPLSHPAAPNSVTSWI